jgi:hypothetical protein
LKVFEATPISANRSKDRLSSSSSSSMVSVIAANPNSNKSAINQNSNKSSINPNYSVIKPMSRSEQKKSSSFSSDAEDSGGTKFIEDYMSKIVQQVKSFSHVKDSPAGKIIFTYQRLFSR